MANLFAISGWQMQITFFKRLFSSFSRKIKYPQRLKDFKYVTKSWVGNKVFLKDIVLFYFGLLWLVN